MPDQTLQAADAADLKGPVCIHTEQIIDSCLDKDCVEDLRVYLTQESQAALDGATGAKTRCAELLCASVSVEALEYKSGHYAVDVTYYYRIVGDAAAGSLRPTTIAGLAVFSKRSVLYGGSSGKRSFRSDAAPAPLGSSLPVAVVEVLEPMILASRLREVCECRRCEPELAQIPEAISALFGEPLVLAGGAKHLYVTIGQFSTLHLQRGSQLCIPVCDYCAPQRECCPEEGCPEDPCELFSRIEFPLQSFFPDGSESAGRGCGCGE